MSSPGVPTLFVSVSSYLVNSERESPKVVHSSNGTVPSTACSVLTVEINTFSGWSVINAAAVQLTNDARLKVCYTHKS